jgi:hypothetical protein
MKTSERNVCLMAACAALILSAVVYAPAFKGMIPFPADYVFDFPPFAPVMPSYVSTVQTNIGDLVTSFYPYRTIGARGAREWTLPLWNPYMLSGAPFQAMPQSALFYPPNFLYYVLPVPAAWLIGFFLRRLLAVTFTALFLRRIGATPAGSIAAGLIFGFCGFLTAWQGQSMSDAAIWLPLMCYAVLRLYEQPGRRSIAIAAFAFAMPVLAGHPETAAHLMLTVVALALFIFVANRSFSFIRGFTIAGLLAVVLAAVQIIPTIEWLKYIHGALKVEWPPLPLWSIVGLVSRDIIRAKTQVGLLIPEQAAYIAMMTFIAAPAALLRKSWRGFALFFAFWTVAALSVVYGVGPVHKIVQWIPVLSTLKNTRLLLVGSFGFSVMAGLGISAIEQWQTDDSQVRTWIAVLMVSAGCIPPLALIYLLHRVPVQEMIELVRVPRFGMYLLFASLILVYLRLAGRLSPALFRPLTLILIVVDLATVSYGAIPFTKPRDVFPRIDLFERLPDPRSQPFRIAQLGAAYGANFELMYGYAELGGYELALENLKTLFKDLSRDELDSLMLTTSAVLETRDRRIDMLNVKYYVVSEWDSRYLEFRDQPDRFRFLYAYGDTDVIENLKVMPAAYLVPTAGIEVVPDEERALQRLKDPDFDAERTVILPNPPPPSLPRMPQAHSVAAPQVEWTARRMNDFELNVQTPQPSVLVVSQMSYPGWKAYIDGDAVPITRANYALPAIFVGSGTHHVRFSFEPWVFKVGLSLSIIAGVICACLLMIRSKASSA